MNYFLKALRIAGIVTDWAAKALVDGKISAQEAVDLAVRIADALGIPCEVDLSK
ncbi:hypothetical protein ES702_06227 [subsurface metagenome]